MAPSSGQTEVANLFISIKYVFFYVFFISFSTWRFMLHYYCICMDGKKYEFCVDNIILIFLAILTVSNYIATITDCTCKHNTMLRQDNASLQSPYSIRLKYCIK